MRNKDKVVWSSTQDYDWIWYEASDDEIREWFTDQFGDYGDEEYNEIIEADDIEEMRSILSDDFSYDYSYEDLTESIIPEIEKQCYHDYLWMIGNYQRWDGGREALGFFTDAEKGIIDTCYPNYDSHSKLINDDGNLAFTESTHDTPMGGTLMTLYSFKDRASYDAAEAFVSTKEFADKEFEGEELERFYNNMESWYDGNYSGTVEEYAEDFDAVSTWIDNGWLTPVSAKLW